MCVVSHRPAVLRRADRVLMGGGRLGAAGTLDELPVSSGRDAAAVAEGGLGGGVNERSREIGRYRMTCLPAAPQVRRSVLLT